MFFNYKSDDWYKLFTNQQKISVAAYEHTRMAVFDVFLI